MLSPEMLDKVCLLSPSFQLQLRKMLSGYKSLINSYSFVSIITSILYRIYIFVPIFLVFYLTVCILDKRRQNNKEKQHIDEEVKQVAV